MPLFLKSIDPKINILGNEQVFKFNADQINNDANLILFNDFVSTAGIFSSTGFSFIGNNLKGFQFKHELYNGSIYGDFLFKTYSKFGIGSDIFKYDEVTDSLIFYKNVIISGSEVVTKSYVDNHTWLSTSITDLAPTVKLYSLDSFAVPVFDLNVNSKKITNLANGNSNNDAVNLGQLNALGFSSLTNNGFLVRTAANTYVNRIFNVGSSNLSINNADGVLGNPLLDFSVTPTFDRITINNNPISSTDAINKAYIDQYIDSIVAGIDFKNPCNTATVSNLSATYNNGISGVGATLTNNGTLGVLIIDGVTQILDNRVLVRNQTISSQNGIYKVTNVGSASVAWVLTRTDDYNSSTKITPGNMVAIQSGTKNTGTTWLQTANITTVGTDSIIFTQFSYGASSFLEVANNLSDLTDVSIARSNLGLSTAVTSVTGTNNQINISGTTNSPVLSLANIATSGTYSYPSSLELDSTGRVSSVTSGVAPGTVMSITAGTGLSGGTITETGTISIAAISGFSPGVYNWPNSLTINAQGQVIGASAGVQPITSIISNSGLTVNINNGQALVNMFDTGVTSGTYTWPSSFSVNSMGQLTSVTSSGSFPINRLVGYPSDSSVFLRGDGSWATPATNITLPLNLYTSSVTSGITLYNSNNSATTAFWAYNQNTNNGAQFGYNSSTGEGYVWAGAGLSLKFGTNDTLRARILSNGTFDLLSNNLSTSGIIWANGVGSVIGGTINMQNPVWMNGHRIQSLATPIDYYDAANKGYVDSVVGSGGLSAGEINVNTSGGNTNWIRRSNITRTGVQIYGLTSKGQMLENTNAESAGIGYDGSPDACTIWTAGDTGSYLNIQDEDNSNTRVAYVSNGGAWTQVSSAKRKHSIKEKNNNNVLDRFLKLSVKSYGYKYDIDDDFSDMKKQRIEKKSKRMSIGFILEELFEVFPNCISDYNNELFQKKDTNKKLILEEQIKDITNAGISYNTLLCYFIMAFQEFVQQTNNNILELRGKK